MTTTVDWETVWKVRRDICSLYHEQVTYTGLDGDLPFGLLYTLPYWEILVTPLPPMPTEEQDFIHGGCLVMMLTMCCDHH